MEPAPETRELTVVSLHPGVTREDVIEKTGWSIRFAEEVAETPPPDVTELAVLRDLHERTRRAHGAAA
jgi:glutaconate CoA-transferase, subunit B